MKRVMNGSTHWKIHARARFAAILSMRFGCLVLAVIAIMATLRIALGR